MMKSTRNQPASHAAGRGGKSKGGAAYPPQSSPVKASDADELLHHALATMSMRDRDASSDAANSASSAKENVRPGNNAGKKSKWRKKLDRDNRRVAADGGGTGTDGLAPAYGFEKSATDAKKARGGKKLNLKNKKAVVVEISSPPSILPPEEFDAMAAAAYDAEGSPASSNDTATTHGRGGKKGQKNKNKNRKFPVRHKPKAKKGGGGPNGAAAADYATNETGASVLAMLGQYPYAHPNYAVGLPIDDAPTTPTMEHGQEGYPVTYDPSSYAAYGQPYYGYPYATPVQPDAAASEAQEQHGQQPAVMMPAGYYVPVYYGHGDQYAAPAGYPVYYPVQGYGAPYGVQPQEQQLEEKEQEPGSTPTTPLNVDAPAFNPKGMHG